MIKLSDLLGKPLISLADAENVGYISNVWFDSKLLRALTAEIINDDDDSGERAFAPLRNMQCDGDAAVIKSPNGISCNNLSSAITPCPINRLCYSVSGKALGKVRDVTIDNCLVTEIICENATFTPKELLSLSNNLCIFNDTGKSVKLPKPRVPKPKKEHGEMPVSIHAAIETPTSPQSVTVTRTPGEPVKDYSFLMGKPVRTAVTSGGKIIIPAGTVVTDEVIAIARKENKLVQLALRAY